MHLSLLFWFALFLPGYVLVRRLFPDCLESGLLGTFGLGYIAVLGVLSPLSIASYWLELPLGVFSAGCVALILLAPIEISRRGWWKDFFKLLRGGLAFAMLIVAIDVILGVRAGAGFDGDARVHLARIRFLIDHGMNNFDPFCAIPYFFPIYHTNIEHALLAAATQITPADHFSVWYASPALVKLLIAAGAYYLVWSAFGRNWPAWIAAVFTIGAYGSVPFMIYPNKLSAYWLVPYLIGFTIQTCRAECPRNAPLKLGFATLVLGQIHGLYTACTVGVLAPVIGAILLARIAIRRPSAKRLASCLVTLCLALPFPFIAKARSRPITTNAATAIEASDRTYLALAGGRHMVNPALGFGGGGAWTWGLLGVGTTLALRSPRRREGLVVLSIAGVLAAVFYIPPLCTAALRAIPEEWILGRCGFVLRLALLALGPGAIAYVIEPKTRFAVVRWLLCAAGFAAGAVYAGNERPFDWPSHFERAFSPEKYRRREAASYSNLVSFLKQNIPAGRTILADEHLGIDLVMAHDLYLIASGSGSTGVPDLAERRRDLDALLHPQTPWPKRRELLRKYEIEFFYPADQDANWVHGHLLEPVQSGASVPILRLETD